MPISRPKTGRWSLHRATSLLSKLRRSRFSLGSFADADGGPWSVTVNWGDGSPNTTFNEASQGSLGTQTHTYAEEGTFQVTETVTDSTQLSDSKTFNVTVSDPPVTVNANSGGTLTSIAEGQSTPAGTVVGTFTDTGNPTGTFDPTQTSVQPEYVVVDHLGERVH